MAKTDDKELTVTMGKANADDSSFKCRAGKVRQRIGESRGGAQNCVELSEKDIQEGRGQRAEGSHVEIANQSAQDTVQEETEVPGRSRRRSGGHGIHHMVQEDPPSPMGPGLGKGQNWVRVEERALG